MTTTLSRAELEPCVAWARTRPPDYDQSELGSCGSPRCVVGEALRRKGVLEPWRWPQGADPWTRAALRWLRRSNARILNVIPAITDNGEVDYSKVVPDCAADMLVAMNRGDAADILAKMDHAAAVRILAEIGAAHAALIIYEMDPDAANRIRVALAKIK